MNAFGVDSPPWKLERCQLIQYEIDLVPQEKSIANLLFLVGHDANKSFYLKRTKPLKMPLGKDEWVKILPEGCWVDQY